MGNRTISETTADYEMVMGAEKYGEQHMYLYVDKAGTYWWRYVGDFTASDLCDLAYQEVDDWYGSMSEAIEIGYCYWRATYGITKIHSSVGPVDARQGEGIHYDTGIVEASTNDGWKIRMSFGGGLTSGYDDAIVAQITFLNTESILYDVTAPSLELSGASAWNTSNTINIIATDNVGVTGMRINDIEVAADSKKYKVYKNGSYTIRVIDAGGNATAKTIEIKNIDTIKPKITSVEIA